LENRDRIGPNLRETRPTIFVGVPRIFEKIYGRVRENAAAKGKMNLGAAELEHCSRSRARPFRTWTSTDTRRAFNKAQLATVLVFKKWRDALGGRIRLLISGGAALPEN